MHRSLAVLAAATLAVPAALAQNYLGLAPTQNASAFRAQAGQTLSFVCPANDGSKARLYGTDTYTDDSAICAAAIHAGVLKPGRAGVVTIRVGDGAKAFKGSERNGIKSLDYGAWGYSYSFVQEGSPGSITWKTVWNGIPDDFKEPIVVNCPHEGEMGKAIWGTDVYTRDSTICVAAVHMGLIDAGKGGLIAVQRVPPPKEYAGSERFGVTSRRWGSAADAFTVAAAEPAREPAPPPPTPPTPPRVNIAARTLTVAGFTAAGNAPTTAAIAPRSIGIAGFTATGTATNAPTIAPRILQASGWTAVGTAP